MNEWFQIGIHKVNRLLRSDGDFQELYKEIKIAEENYQTVLDKLSPEDQWVVENYIALCEEIERKRTMIAYVCGKKDQ